MELNTIVLELLSRIQVLEQKVAVLENNRQENNNANSSKPPFPANKISNKYKGLAEYLYEKWEKKISLTYGEIERCLGFSLPDTATNFPQSYWANTRTHTYASSWLELGYKAKVDGETSIVTFERSAF